MKTLARLLVSAAMVFACAGAGAENYPDRPVRWIVPYPPGGVTDVLARMVANVMQANMGQPFVIDNRTGGSTNIANQALVSAKPDGYTLLTAENAALLFNEHLFKKLGFSPDKDFTYIGTMGRVPLALVVNPDFPARTVNEFVDYVKKTPGKLNYASAGNGSPHHIGMERVKQTVGIDMQHVPYRGAAPAIQDLVSGRVQTMLLDLGSGLPYMRSGQVRVLAVGTAQRTALLPDVPTFAEAGFKGLEIFGFQGVVAPANLKPEVAARLSAELAKAMKDPNVVSRLADLGVEPLNLVGNEFKREARDESGKWGAVIRKASITLD